MSSDPRSSKPALAIGAGLPLKRRELPGLLNGHSEGWEEIPADRRLSPGEEVYPVLGTEKTDVQPCVITHEGTLKELLVGLDSTPVRMFRRKSVPAQPADRPATAGRIASR